MGFAGRAKHNWRQAESVDGLQHSARRTDFLGTREADQVRFPIQLQVSEAPAVMAGVFCCRGIGVKRIAAHVTDMRQIEIEAINFIAAAFRP